MKNGHKPFIVNNPGYVKTLGPVVTIAKNGALAAAEQVVDDEFIYKTSTLQHLGDNIPTDDDKSQWLINRILRDHLLNVEAGNFAGDVTIGGDLTVAKKITANTYNNLPIASTTKYGITRLASSTADPDKDDVVTMRLLKDGVLNRLAYLEECCEEVQELLKKNFTVTYTLVDATSSNIDDEVEPDAEFTTTITNTNGVASGYAFETLKVLVGGYDITDDVVEHAKNSGTATISIPHVFGDVEIIAQSKDIYHVVGTADPSGAVITALTGFDKYVYAGEEYLGIFFITPNYQSNYTPYLDYSSADTQLDILIAQAYSYGNIVSKHINSDTTFVLRFVETPTPQLITIVANHAQYSIGGQTTTPLIGEQFTIIAGPDSGYKIDKNNPSEYITVVKTGTTESVPFTVDEFGSSGSGYVGIVFTVTAPITVTITAKPESSEPTVYNVTKNATHATITGANTVQENDDYTATIAPAAGYTVKKANITVKNSSNQNVSFTYTNGTLTVPDVTSNITITVIASKQTTTTYTITRNYTSSQVTLTQSTTGDTITAGSTYTVSAAPKSGYQIDSMTVTQGGSSVSVSNNSATINNVTGNIVVTVESSLVPVEIPEALKKVASIDIHEDSKSFRGEMDLRIGTNSGQMAAVLPRTNRGASYNYYGVSNGDGSYYFTNAKYHIGAPLSESNYCYIRIEMKSGSDYADTYAAMEYIFEKINNHNDNVAKCYDYCVCYSSSNGSDYAVISLYPIKFNPGEARTIEVDLGIPSGVTVTNTHSGGGSTVYVKQDKSRAIYEIVDGNDNAIPFTFGAGTYMRQGGVGTASTASMTDEQAADVFGWGRQGMLGIKTTGTHQFKLRVFGIADRPQYTNEQYVGGDGSDKDTYRYVLGDVDYNTADNHHNGVVTPFEWDFSSGVRNSDDHDVYAQITGTGTNGEFVQTRVTDAGGDPQYTWVLETREYATLGSNVYSVGECIEIPFNVTITQPAEGVTDVGPSSILCKLHGLSSSATTSDKVYAPNMDNGVYWAYPITLTFDKTQVNMSVHNTAINNYAIEYDKLFAMTYGPKSGYEITDGTMVAQSQTTQLGPVDVTKTVDNIAIDSTGVQVSIVSQLKSS